MHRPRWSHFGMFLVGFGFIFAGVFVGLVAVEYEFVHQTTTGDAQDVSDEIDRYSVVAYEELSSEERLLVDRAIEGERHRVETDDEMAVRWGGGRVVSQGDRYHLIVRRTVVDWSSPVSIAALAFGIGGVLLLVESIRRHHFPHYRPLEVVR